MGKGSGFLPVYTSHTTPWWLCFQAYSRVQSQGPFITVVQVPMMLLYRRGKVCVKALSKGGDCPQKWQGMTLNPRPLDNDNVINLKR